MAKNSGLLRYYPQEQVILSMTPPHLWVPNTLIIWVHGNYLLLHYGNFHNANNNAIL